MSDTHRCRNLTEEECALVKRIDKISHVYDDICKMIAHLNGSLSQNDWYFIQHSFQMREDAGIGKKIDSHYLNEMNEDSQEYYEEIQRVRELLQRALVLTTVREISFIGDEKDE